MFDLPIRGIYGIQGILYQTSSSPHTPQQNGVVEHMNKQLIETTLTLLLHVNVPSHFLEDVVLTPCQCQCPFLPIGCHHFFV